MKFTPLNNPNISLTRFDSVSPTLRLDSIGYPHLSWIDKKNGYNEICYKYWNGFDWDYYQKPNFARSKEEINISPNAFVLDSNDKPIIVYAKKDISNNNILSVSSPTSGIWQTREQIVDYNILWVGIYRYDRDIMFSSSSSSSSSSRDSSSSSSESSDNYSESSSSSSLIDSSSSSSNISSNSSSSSSNISSDSSSSSSDNYSESSSSSSDNYSESSSSSSDNYSESSFSSSLDYSSSSSSLDSSSSSSIDDGTIFIVTYDDENTMRIYSLTSIFRLLGSIFVEIPDVEFLKTATCGKRVGMAYIDSGNIIKYNFFDFDDLSWSFGSFITLSSSISGYSVDSMVVAGCTSEDSSIMNICFSNTDNSDSAITYCKVNEAGDEACQTVEAVTSTVNASDGFKINGYNSLGICLDENNYPKVFASGAKTALFSFDGSVWTKEDVDINYSLIMSPQNISTAYDLSQSAVNVSFSNNGNIYLMVQSNSAGFEQVSPQISILNSKRLFIANWTSGIINIGEQIYGSYKTIASDVLKDSIAKVGIFVNDEEDPFVCTSSSSSSYDSSSSSSSSLGDI